MATTKRDLTDQCCEYPGCSVGCTALCCTGYGCKWLCVEHAKKPFPQPVPAPPEAGGVTLAALDALISRNERESYAPCVAAHAMLRALRPLVERKACEDRIEATNAVIIYRVSFVNPTDANEFGHLFQAAAWAEAQAAKREPQRSKPVGGMTEDERFDLALKLRGGVSHDWLRTIAAAHQRWDPATDTILLPQ